MEKGRVGESYMICGDPLTRVEALDLAEPVTGIPRPASVPPANGRRASRQRAAAASGAAQLLM